MLFGVSGSQPVAAAVSASAPGAKEIASVPPATTNGQRNCFVLRHNIHRSLLRCMLHQWPKLRLPCIWEMFQSTFIWVRMLRQRPCCYGSYSHAECFYWSGQGLYCLRLHRSQTRNRWSVQHGSAAVPAGSVHQHAVSVLWPTPGQDQSTVLGG